MKFGSAIPIALAAGAVTVAGVSLLIARSIGPRSQVVDPQEPHKHIPTSLITPPEKEAKALKIAILRTAWNESMILPMTQGVFNTLMEKGMAPENVQEIVVPGSYELPIIARYVAESGKYDAVLCLGVLIKGETAHFEYISDAVAKGLMQVQMDTLIPVLYGVLNCYNESQAIARTRVDADGPYSLAISALHMAHLKATMK